MKAYVYSIRNSVSGKQYVGKSIDPEFRWQSHQYNVQKDWSSKLYRALKKHGLDAFTFEVLFEYETEDEAYNAERLIIQERDMYVNGYNMNEGGKEVFVPTKRQEDVKANR